MARPKGSTKKNRATNKPKKEKLVEVKTPEKVDVKPTKEVYIETPEKEIVDVVEPISTETIQKDEVVEPTETKKENIMAETIEKTKSVEEVIPQNNFNPLNEEVVIRDYTQDMIKANMGGDIPTEGVEYDIPEPTYDNPISPEEEDIPSSPSRGNSNQSSSSSSSYSEPQQSINPSLDDLPAKEKRKAAKKTAEALLATYARVFPYPFKKISSFNMNKMERLDMAGEIDLKMPVTEDGKTVKQHMDSVNQQVEDVFQVTEEMQEELREPLVDLLMEQELALTPTQRLLIVFGGQAVQFATATIQIAVSNKQALEQFKDFRASQGNKRPTYQQQAPPQQQQTQQQAPPQQQATSSNGQEGYEAPIVEEDEYEAPEINLSDYMSGNVPSEDDEIASVENGGITQEDIPNE